MQGTSFVSLLEGETPLDWQDSMYYHYYEFPFWHHVQPHYGIRTQEYTLAHFYYNIDVWELYDLKKDPNQMNNIYNHPDYGDIVSELKFKLKDLMIKFEDDKSLSDFKKITDTDFGRIVDDIKAEESVHQILNKK